MYLFERNVKSYANVLTEGANINMSEFYCFRTDLANTMFSRIRYIETWVTATEFYLYFIKCFLKSVDLENNARVFFYSKKYNSGVCYSKR